MKIRIAVAVDPTGAWCACGSSAQCVESQMDFSVSAVGPGEVCYWVEANVQVPITKKIVGKVAPKEE